MPNSPAEFTALALAEYKALRDESLRCSQFLTNSVLAALASYGVTLVAAATFVKRGDGSMPSIPAVILQVVGTALCVQAMLAGATYLSELQKYIRIGVYIREHLERHLDYTLLASGIAVRPLRWEHWIARRRARAIYIVAVAAIQLPVVAVGLLLLLGILLQYKIASLEAGLFAPVASKIGDGGAGQWLLLTIVLSDVITMLAIGLRVLAEERGGAAFHPVDGKEQPRTPIVGGPPQIELSFVIPVRRDPRALDCVVALTRYANERGVRAEIIVAGEFDHEYRASQARYVSVYPAEKGRATRIGVLESVGAVVVVCDSDLPVTLRDLDALRAAAITTGVAFGSRSHRDAYIVRHPPLMRRVASRCFRIAATKLLGLRNYDAQCGAKAFRRDVVPNLFQDQWVYGFAYDVEIALRAEALTRSEEATFGVTHVPVGWRYDPHTTVRLWRDGPRMFRALLHLRSKREHLPR